MGHPESISARARQVGTLGLLSAIIAFFVLFCALLFAFYPAFWSSARFPPYRDNMCSNNRIDSARGYRISCIFSLISVGDPIASSRLKRASMNSTLPPPSAAGRVMLTTDINSRCEHV
ncbi:hypothetical protein PLICRDRAFT_605093 [Plicaturopsis crispa FD-325 SS-3]|nr:hypothetical protein PLICRDRAFT_605093 [Plicaturopsis crispa FD-325 SS-3]